MSAHRVLHDAFNAPFQMTDPGDAGTITVDRWMAVVPLVSAAAETRILAAPTKAGLMCMLEVVTYVGDITLTVTGGYNQADTASITFSTAEDLVIFVSIKSGTDYVWRVVRHEGCTLTETGGGTITAQTITSLSSTNANATTAILTNATVGRLQTTATAVTAAGNNIANAGNLSYGMNVVTGTDNATGVILPVAVANGVVEILQTVNAKTLLVWPQVNSAIGGLAANVNFATGTANTAAISGTTQNVYAKFIATNATQWYPVK